MTVLDLLLLLAATMYTADVITSKSGPFSIFTRLRARFTWGGLLSCIWCCAPWLAGALLLIYLAVPYGHYLIEVLAIAGLALALRAYTGLGVGNGGH